MTYICKIFGFRPEVNSHVVIELKRNTRIGRAASLAGFVSTVDPDQISLRNLVLFSPRGRGLRTEDYRSIPVESIELGYQI